MKAILASLLLLAMTLSVQAQLRLGFDINNMKTAWPTSLGVPFQVWRGLGASVQWPDIQPTAANSYSWSRFDTFTGEAKKNGQDILYTVYFTPAWANSQGRQYPPTDVDTTDQMLITFITAVYNHTKLTGNHIKYWECWNEPNNSNEYGGTTSQLVRMCSDIYKTVHALDSTALVLTPPFCSWNFPGGGHTPPGSDASPQFKKYLLAGGATVADIVAFHLYVWSDPSEVPAANNPGITVQQTIANFRTVADSSGMANKPLWSTEGSDLAMSSTTDANIQAALMAHYILQSSQLAVMIYYGWDFVAPWGLVTTPGSPTTTLKPNGEAWIQVANWLSRGVKSLCSNSGTIYSCSFNDGSVAMWDDAQTCSPCTTQSHKVTGYAITSDITGAKSLISNGTVPLGLKPILLSQYGVIGNGLYIAGRMVVSGKQTVN